MTEHRTPLRVSGGQASIAYLVVPIALLGWTFLTTPLTDNNGGLDTDGVLYAAMAGMEGLDERAARMAPWCYRVLTPWIAGLLPLETIAAFETLAVATNWLCLVLVYLLLRRCGLSHRAAVLGQLWYSGIFWTLKFSFYSPCYVDFQTQLFLLAALTLLAAGRSWAVPALLAVGVLQKESLIALVPVAAVARAHDDGLRRRETWIYFAVLVGLPAASLVSVRAWIEPLNEFSPFGAWGFDLAPLADPAFWPRLLLAAFSGLGLLPAVALARGRQSVELLARNPMWLTMAVVATAMLFGGMDKSRLFLYLVPVAVWLVASVTGGDVDAPNWRSALCLCAGLVLHFYLGNHLMPMGTFEDYLNRLVPIHAPGPLTPTVIRTAGVLAVWVAVVLATGFERKRVRPAAPVRGR